MVWVSDEYRAKFLELFEDYLTKDTDAGNARNRELVANIGRIRAAVLEDLWQSEGSRMPPVPAGGSCGSRRATRPRALRAFAAGR